MPPRRATQGCPARINVEPQEQGVPNATNVQPQGEVTNVEFCEAIEMLSLAGTNQDSLSVHEYGLKFTQLSRYAPEMVKDMRSRMNFFVAGLGRLLSKDGRATMLIGDMDISRLMVYVQQVEEEKLMDMEEYKTKKVKTRNESGQQKGSVNRSSFQKQKGPAPSSASAPAPRNRGDYNGQNSQDFRARPAQSQSSVVQGGSLTLACARCGRTHPAKRIDSVAYKLELPQELAVVHLTQVTRINTQCAVDLVERSRVSGELPCISEDPFYSLSSLVH
ncbi:uncharacterized protein LOC125855770 [Solanum stenotomum]|uniref:uncharacterized protein LOC125855770 n=1 Tax=Solanum stenotomum TaxID=172797 RepID=UPI0020CFFF15|nr:uncharacterized protein LOC125855770 [Solanum stenotomum]